MAEIGIVIVTFQSAAVIGACLDAVLSTGADVVVVDNASRDGTAEQVAARGARLIVNASNRGFAAAVNQGFQTLDCPYILLLNPDAVLISGLDALRAACDLPRAAGAGGLLLDPDGRPQTGFMARSLPTPAALVLEALVLNRLWPKNPVNRRYRNLGLDYSLQQTVEQPAGAFLMIRRSVWQEMGGFDEGFFPLWFEDVDFCRRAADRNHRLYFEPRAVAKHTGAHSISDLPVEMRQVYWYRSLLRYAAKHFSLWGLRTVCLAVMAGSLLRMAIRSAALRSLSPLQAGWTVFRLARQYAVRGSAARFGLES